MVVSRPQPLIRSSLLAEFPALVEELGGPLDLIVEEAGLCLALLALSDRRGGVGLATAALLIDTLSAPAWSSSLTSRRSRTPPPTVNGTATVDAVRSTSCRPSRP